MAKKNSTKTATKEALQASEPRLMTFKGWKGININEAPLGWNPIEAGEFNESDLMPNYLSVQNNADTTPTGSIETRKDTKIIAVPPEGLTFNGVSCLREDYLICAFSDNSIRWIRLGTDEWNEITVTNVDSENGLGVGRHWTSIGYYENTLICLTGPIDEDNNDSGIKGEIFTGEFPQGKPPEGISNAKTIPNPTVAPTLKAMGSLEEGNVSRVSVGYVYANKFGTTLDVIDWSTIIVSDGPERWHGGKYLNITGPIPQGYEISGVDLYCKVDDNSDAIFIGHVDIGTAQTTFSFNWLGAMADTSSWTSVSLQLPTENTTKGVDASYFRVHDGRIYFWGGSIRYRLWIGGNPGNELSVARGIGGAFVDIEPGNGMEVKGTAKFQTYNGASIVTIMCSNPNTSKVKRYNLLETNLTISNELATKGFMTEEVANVVGCTSHYGFGAWADGLYTVNRYGLMITTMAMENSNQLRATSVSGNIQPIFNDIKASRLSKSHLLYIDDKLYLIMGAEPGDYSERSSDEDIVKNLYDTLDSLIICYDINTKCWWTYTFDLDETVISVVNIDSEDHWEGLGIITPYKFCIIPTTGPTAYTPPMWNGEDPEKAFDVTIETGELTARTPPQQTTYISQLEFRFDYIIGDLQIVVDGIDYYGRRRTISKDVSVNEMKRRYQVWMRIDELFETYKVTIRGKARFRMTHFIAKLYQQSYKINQVYGHTDHSYYADRHGGDTDIHHALDSYNNLRDAIIP